MTGNEGLAVGITLIPLLLMLTFAAVFFAFLVFWVWMLIDCLVNEKSDGNDKIVWVLVLVFTNWIGALIYFFVRRPQRKRLQNVIPKPLSTIDIQSMKKGALYSPKTGLD